MPLGEHTQNDMRNMHAKFHEFSWHKKEILIYHHFHFINFVEWDNMNEIWKHENVHLVEGIVTKFIPYFSNPYFIWYQILNLMNELVQEG
jgi:hypothetical protein